MAPDNKPETFSLEEWITPVYRFAFRSTGDVHSAEDLTQETLLRAWNKQKQLREQQSLRVWLFRIAANLWKDQLRRRRAPVSQAESLTDNLPGRPAVPLKLMTGEEEHRRVLNVMDSLPPRQREVLYLNACEELKTADISNVLGISIEAVKSNLSLARKRMRNMLDEMIEPITDVYSRPPQ